MTKITKEQVERLNYAIKTLQENQSTVTVSTCIYVGVAIAVVLAIYFLIRTAYEMLEQEQTHSRIKLQELAKHQDEIDERLDNAKSARRDLADAFVELRTKVKALDERVKKLEPVPIEATKALTDITSQFTGKS